jgi:hypothetical protein
VNAVMNVRFPSNAGSSEECRLLGCYIVFLRSVRRLLVTANVVPSSPILVTLKMETLLSSEMAFLTRATRRNNHEDGILHSHLRENLKSLILEWCSVP